MSVVLTPIGIYRNPERKYTYDVGRQATSTHSSYATIESSDIKQIEGWIELNAGHNFEQALIGLQASNFIWLIYEFHQNKTWKPMVMPPRGTESKQGVFATRSPYRPNPIGMSACQIVRIEGLKIYVTLTDLIDETPILDIKPYLASSDSFPNEKPSWLIEDSFQIEQSNLFKVQIQFLESKGLRALRPFTFQQLSEKPLLHPHKRIQAQSQNKGSDSEIENQISSYVLSYRTWRIHFKEIKNTLCLERISSGYHETELVDLADPYSDKELHRQFVKMTWPE